VTRRLLIAAALLAVFAPSASAGGGRFGQEGRWITDAAGRVVVLHGVNMVNKLQASGYTPDAIGFGDDDARFLARNGFNAVRSG
jgi:endoglycosylceramidase